MSDLSVFNKFPIPADDEDPYYESFRGMADNIDEVLIQERIKSNAFLAGGGTITFTPGSNTMTWTSDFVIPVFIYGKKIIVRFGPDEASRTVTVLDGQALVVDIPYSMTDDVVESVSPLSILTPLNYAQYAIGWRYGNTLYLRNLGSF